MKDQFGRRIDYLRVSITDKCNLRCVYCMPVEGPPGNGPARYFKLPGAQGTVGVITPLSHNYCNTCNRMRLTADGRLRTCLFGTHEVDLKTPLRETGNVVAAVEQALAEKPERHFLQIGTVSDSGGLSALSQVGG